MTNANMEVKIKAPIVKIQSALRQITGNPSYRITDEIDLYISVHSLLRFVRPERLLQGWSISANPKQKDFLNREVKINMHFNDPERGLKAAKKLERLVTQP